MNYKIELLPMAWEELKGIQDYYCLNSGAASAKKVRNHILDTIARLKDHPDSGSFVPDQWMADRDYRMVIANRHIAIDKKNEDAKTIFVYHIADTRTEYKKLFGDKTDW